MTSETPVKPKRGKKPDSHQMKEIDFHIAQRITRRRTSIGMTQTDLSRKIGLTYQQVQKYERGVNRVSAGVLFNIARAMGVSPNHFYHGADLTETDPSAGTACEGLLHTRGGETLAQTYLALSDRDRRAVFTLAQTLANHRKEET